MKGGDMLNMNKFCKGLILVGAFVGANTSAKTLISERVVRLPVDLSMSKVVSSNAGYGTTYLVKVLVPALAGPTLMKHRNEGESAPCLATYGTNKVLDVVQGRPETILTDFKIQLVKFVSRDVEKQICRVILQENITASIRGYEFVHTRESEMPERHIEDCD